MTTTHAADRRVGPFLALLLLLSVPAGAQHVALPPTLPGDGSEPARLEGFLLPAEVRTDTDRTLSLCLVNHGPGAELRRDDLTGGSGDVIRLAVPLGPDDHHLAVATASLNCIPADAEWDCTVERTTPELAVVEIRPAAATARIDPGASTCFDLTGVAVNEAEGVALLPLKVAASRERAVLLDDRPLTVIKSLDGWIRHVDLPDVEEDQHHQYPIPTSGIEEDAIVAELIAEGAVGSFELENEGIRAEDIASDAVGTDEILDGTIALADLGANGASPDDVLRWTGSGWAVGADEDDDWTVEGTDIHRANGRVGVGTDDPAAPLHVRSGLAGGDEPASHVMVIENDGASDEKGGLAIVLHEPGSGVASEATDISRNDHFVTFYGSEDRIVGRVNGQNVFEYATLETAAEGPVAELGLTSLLTLYQLELEYEPDFVDIVWPTIDWPGAGFTAPSFSAGSIRGYLGSCDPNRPCTDICLGVAELGYCAPSLSWGDLDDLDEVRLHPGSIDVRPPLFIPEDWLSVNQDLVEDTADSFIGLGAAGWEIFNDPVAAAIRAAELGISDGVTYESGSADYAEWLEREDLAEVLRPGDVVGVHAGRISKRTKDADHVLVVSLKPIVLGNMPEPGREQDFEKVAFMGQTPVMVQGDVHEGDLLIPSGRGDGVAVPIAPEDVRAEHLSQVLGVAWSSVNTHGLLSYVNVAVGLDDGAAAAFALRQSRRLDELETERDDLRVRLRDLEQRLLTLEELTSRQR
ncbi:MAG: hypothetical protein AAF533_02115 [Acidobacteriota bacterium]